MNNPTFRQGDGVLWQEKIPGLAFVYPRALHLLLAAPVFYRMRLEPSRFEHLKKIAHGYFATSARQSTSLLPDLNKDNCSAVYVATVLTCCFSFAQTPGPSHLLVIEDGYEAPRLGLLGGVQFAIESSGFGNIFPGIPSAFVLHATSTRAAIGAGCV
ncbi:hypothetical protein Hte_007632 [Hypoxylon texense]